MPRSGGHNRADLREEWIVTIQPALEIDVAEVNGTGFACADDPRERPTPAHDEDGCAAERRSTEDLRESLLMGPAPHFDFTITTHSSV